MTRQQLVLVQKLVDREREFLLHIVSARHKGDRTAGRHQEIEMPTCALEAELLVAQDLRDILARALNRGGAI